MDSILAALGAVLLIALMLCFGAIAGAMFGALSGWILSWTPFGDWIKHVLDNPGFTLAELGAFLGFVGGFFRASVSTKK